MTSNWINTPDSSNVSGFEYDPETKDLRVGFKSGGLYAYKNVSPVMYEGLTKVESAGSYINQVIKPNREVAKIGTLEVTNG
jgi:KTSC domain